MGKLSSLLAGAMKSTSQKRKEEYARYRNAYLSNPKHKAKNMQTYAQWHQDKYGKYKSKGKATSGSAEKPKEYPTVRTKATHKGLGAAGVKWEEDRPSKKYKRSGKKK